jgi:hypothetical protein
MSSTAGTGSQKIPKKIHYFWFGKGSMSPLEDKCIARFSQFAPGAQVIRWDESNFDVFAHEYTRKAYEDKKWAFVSDYARLKVLEEEGGIYFDTDMYLVKDVSPLFEGKTFFGKEDSVHINAAACGAPQGDPFIKALLQKYDTLTERIPIPKVITEVYSKGDYDVTIYDKDVFYPFSQIEITAFKGSNAPTASYGVHLWNYSWGNPLVRRWKKFPLYKKLVGVAEKLHIKRLLKKILNLE